MVVILIAFCLEFSVFGLEFALTAVEGIKKAFGVLLFKYASNNLSDCAMRFPVKLTNKLLGLNE